MIREVIIGLIGLFIAGCQTISAVTAEQDKASASLAAPDDNKQAPMQQVTRPAIDPRAEEILKKASAHLKSARRFVFHAEITLDHVLPSGAKLQQSRSADLLVRRPDRIRAESTSDAGIKRYWYNGKTISVYEKDNNVYATIEVPGTIDAALDDAMKRFGLTWPLVDLVVSDPYTNFMQRVNSGAYAGLAYLDGAKYHHLLFSQDSADFQLWVEEGRTPEIRKLVITYKQMDSSPQYTALLSNWNFGPKAPDGDFEFTPPKGAKKIEFLPLASTSGG